MTFRTEIDGAGRECIVGKVDARDEYLVLEHVLHDRANGPDIVVSEQIECARNVGDLANRHSLGRAR